MTGQRDQQSHIRWFRDIRLGDVAAVGGKTASMGELYSVLAQHGVRVPNGFAVEIEAQAGTVLTVATSAAEKVYRSDGPTAELSVNLAARAGSQVEWLPQETILFDQARFARRLDADIAEDAAVPCPLEEPSRPGRRVQPVRPQPEHLDDATDGAVGDQLAGAHAGLAVQPLAVIDGVLPAGGGRDRARPLQVVE